MMEKMECISLKRKDKKDEDYTLAQSLGVVSKPRTKGGLRIIYLINTCRKSHNSIHVNLVTLLSINHGI